MIPRIPRWLLGIGVFFVFLIFGFSTFHLTCRKAPDTYKPITQNAYLDRFTEQQKRTEESTYLTFPEWYLVFNPQELGRHLKTQFPSTFGYFASIGQFWKGYCKVYGIANQYYPSNIGNQFMIMVIGTSATVEYGIKGIYSSTIGRIFEWSAGELSDEDRLAASIMIDYAKFVETRPFYEYPYGSKLVEIWKTPWTGRSFIRKWERKIVLTVEYGVKALYSKVIWLGTRAIYGAPDMVDYVLVSTQGTSTQRMIELPHYQGFTDALPRLSASSTKIHSVSGNDEMLVTVTGPKTLIPDWNIGKVIFEQSFIVEPKIRYAVQVPTNDLLAFIDRIQKQGMSLEHAFDY